MALLQPGVQSPLGLQPVRTLTSAAWSGAVKTYVIANNGTSVSTNLFLGDPVTYSYTLAGGAGTQASFAYSGTIQQYMNTPTVTGSTDIPVLGVFVGCFYITPANNSPWTYTPANSVVSGTTFAANTLPIAMVVDDPSVVFWAQADNAAVLGTTGNYPATVQGYVGLNAQLVNASSTSGNPVTGTSAFSLSNTTLTGTMLAANAAYPLKIRGFVPEQDYPQTAISMSPSMTLPYSVLEVVLNNHIYKAGTASA
jgi:hypothetical protein